MARVSRSATQEALCRGATAGGVGSPSSAMSRSATDRGYLLVDRHVEKNAGSTYRELLFQAESRGLCMYWGYQQRSTAWTKFVPLMRKLSADAVAPRICMEAHSHIDHVIPWLDRLVRAK